MSKSILPINESQIQRDIESLGFKTISKFDTSKITINPLLCDSSLLPHLALDLDVNIDGLDEDEQRTYLQNAREIKKYAGSVYAVKTAASSIFQDVKLLQWFDYGGVPNRFKLIIQIINKPINNDNLNKLNKLIERAKRKSSHLEGIDVLNNQQQKLILSTGSTGEVQYKAQMVNGYESISTGSNKINLGVIGEISSYAIQI